MPGRPDLLPDLIQTADWPEGAKTIEEKIMAVYDARNRAGWAWLSNDLHPERPPALLPWSSCLPSIYDPARLLDAEHDDEGFCGAHWGYDFYPALDGGLQHRISVRWNQFKSHGVAASLLPDPPPELVAAREARWARYRAIETGEDEDAAP